MAEPPRRRTALQGRVRRVERLSPSFVRVVLGGDGLRSFAPSPFADSYVKLVFLEPDVPEPLPLDDAGRLDLTASGTTGPSSAAPRLRAYTVRRWDPDARELTLDIVVHGEVGLGGRWALRAAAGDAVWVLGPGGAYSPDPAADHHLLVGDESAVPAISVSVENLPAGARARVVVEVPAATDQLPLDVPDRCDVEVTWLVRGDDVVGRRLVRATRDMDWPSGRIQAFVHGEAGMVADLRRYLRLERRVPREDLSISGYWRLGADDEGWRAAKKRWAAELEAAENKAGIG